MLFYFNIKKTQCVECRGGGEGAHRRPGRHGNQPDGPPPSAGPAAGQQSRIRVAKRVGRPAVGDPHLGQAPPHAQVPHGPRCGRVHDPHPFFFVLTTPVAHRTYHRTRTRTEQGIPTIHYRWLLHSAEQGCPLPYRPYLLPAGVSLVDEKRIFQYAHLLRLGRGWRG